MSYREDLAYIHHAGFSEFAASAAPGVIDLLLAHGVRDGLVVEAGCGSGILARELRLAGFEVLGFDASPAMIALARGAGVPPASAGHPARRPMPVSGERDARPPTFAVGSFDTFDLPPCNAIVAMGEVLNCGTFGGVRAFIARAASVLRPGGVLLFDVAERDSYPLYEERRVDGDDWSVITVKESDGTHLRRRILTFRGVGETMRRDEELHTLELHDRAAMEALLRDHGFRISVRRSYGTRRLPKGHSVYLGVRRRESPPLVPRRRLASPHS